MAPALQKYGPKLRHEVSLHRRKGKFRLTLSRHIIKDSPHVNHSPADTTMNWRSQPAIHAPEPRRPAVASSAIHLFPPTPAPQVVDASNATLGYRFLLNPADQPTTKAADSLRNLGKATNRDSVYVVDPRDGDAPRIDTPGLPLRLVESMPPMASLATPVLATSLAPQPVALIVTHPTDLLPQPAAATIEYPTPLSPVDEEDMDVSEGEESAMEDVAATPPPLPITTAKEISSRNDIRERLHYDARRIFHELPDEPSRTALVFGAFVTPTPTTPVVSTSRARAITDIDEDDKKHAVLARSEFAASAEGEVLASNIMKALSPLTPFSQLKRLGSASHDKNDAESTAAIDQGAAADDHPSSSGEEGEIREGVAALSTSHAELVPVPAFGSGKRGPLVTRARYSSSPSFQSATSGDPDSEAEVSRRRNETTRSWLDDEYSDTSDESRFIQGGGIEAAKEIVVHLRVGVGMCKEGVD
ncbi:hypothetical protein DFH06DRAFT_1317115 [Mycena polygramma]|nr:hypothetical protein DFH06DRAFT_1317115 [Mycena polygramma]